MLHPSASLLHHNNRFLFSFNAKASPSHPQSQPNAHSLFSERGSLSFDTPLLSSSSPSTRCSVGRVSSTEPVEFAPPDPGFNFHYEIARLKALQSNLFNAGTLEDKHRVLDGDSRVKRFFYSNSSTVGLASLNLDSYELFLLKCLVAVGQEHVIGSAEMETEESQLDSWKNTVKTALYALAERIENVDVYSSNGTGGFRSKAGIGLEVEAVEDLNKLLKNLLEIEQFYDCMGGIIGYQVTVLELLAQSTSERQHKNRSQHRDGQRDCQFLEIHAPCGINLSQNNEYASQAALWGIEGLPDLGEMYPLGGSADRLGLIDPDTGECLPAAMLPFCGRTLLEGLIRDLQAREYLYFKLYGDQCVTPVAIMTSSAKNNHERITSLCERHAWFGRGQSSFKLFEQPLVPAVRADDGEWLITKQFNPVSKPGGHGVIWKLAYDKGIFKWFHNHGRKGATVRQVSNVVAATDLTLLALAGIGLRQGKKLGFASCKRNSGATEGINVLMEKKNLDGEWEYGLSCIEYTEFDKFGIPDSPASRTWYRTEFPANTNILYVDLNSAEWVGSSRSKRCLPGMVLNTKKPIVYVDHYGRRHSVAGGRLECTMQNIADNFLNTYSTRSYNNVKAGKLDTFIVYNERRRVTSSAKRKRRLGDKSLHQTPEGALLDVLRNAHDLLLECDIELPEIEGNDKYVDSGLPFLILLHPALGPLWEVTRQKFFGGSIYKGSELQLEVAEFLWRNVQLDGSLIVVSDNVLGSTKINETGERILQYGHRCGRCRLENVKVLNKGIDWTCGENIYWKHELRRNEALKIILHGNAEFEATDVALQGNHIFEVPNGYKMKITSRNKGFTVQSEPIEPSMMEAGSWRWNYKIEGTHIQLELIEM